MTIEDYNRIIKQYDEILSYCMGIPQHHEKVMDAKINFVSKAFIDPAFTMKASWYVQQGNAIEMDRVIQMHPFDFCISYANLSKDFDKALDMLQKYLHENIEMKFGKRLT